MSTVILIQARSTSTRFPGKVLESLGDFTVLDHVYYKCAAVRPSIVIIPMGDEPVHNFCIKRRIPYFEGSLDDLLVRHYEAASAYLAKNIVRVTSDCPLVDATRIEMLVKMHEDNEYDFTSNWPSAVDGHDIDIFSMDLLEWLVKYSNEREHVGLDFKQNIKKNMQKWKVCLFQEPYLKEWFPKLSIDTPEDLERVRKIVETMQKNLGELR